MGSDFDGADVRADEAGTGRTKTGLNLTLVRVSQVRLVMGTLRFT